MRSDSSRESLELMRAKKAVWTAAGGVTRGCLVLWAQIGRVIPSETVRTRTSALYPSLTKLPHDHITPAQKLSLATLQLGSSPAILPHRFV